MFSPKTLVGAVILLLVLGLVLAVMGVVTPGVAARIGGSVVAFDALVTSGLWFARHPGAVLRRMGEQPGDPDIVEKSSLELLLLGLDDRSNARALSQMMIELSQGVVSPDDALERRLGEAATRARADMFAVRDRQFRQGWLVDLEDAWKQS